MCALSLEQVAPDFNSLEEQIVAIVQESGRQFYAQVLSAFQQRWLARAWRRVLRCALAFAPLDHPPFGVSSAGAGGAAAPRWTLFYFEQSIVGA